MSDHAVESAGKDCQQAQSHGAVRPLAVCPGAPGRVVKERSDWSLLVSHNYTVGCDLRDECAIPDQLLHRVAGS